MNAAKIQLSKEEIQLLQNADWLLTKNAIIEKLVGAMALLANEWQHQVPEQLRGMPGMAGMLPPKISRGEKYQGLPYVVLDYPRNYGQEQVFALRVLCWWGQFYSITLHTKGRYQHDWAPRISRNLGVLQQEGFKICLDTDEWEQDWRKPAFRSLDCLDSEILYQASFLKLSAIVEINQWEKMPGRMTYLKDLLLGLD